MAKTWNLICIKCARTNKFEFLEGVFKGSASKITGRRSIKKAVNRISSRFVFIFTSLFFFLTYFWFFFFGICLNKCQIKMYGIIIKKVETNFELLNIWAFFLNRNLILIKQKRWRGGEGKFFSYPIFRAIGRWNDLTKKLSKIYREIQTLN